MNNIIYNANPLTGEYVDQSTADESPLEPGVFLVPAHATSEQPPELEKHQVAVLQGTSWEIRADWRGAELYSTSTGELVEIKDIGVVPADVGATDKPRPSPYHVFDAKAGDWIKSEELEMEGLLSLQASLIADIDSVVANLYARLTALEPEYILKAQQAQAFKEKNYQGTPGVLVQAYATATGKTPAGAANLILTKEEAYNKSLVSLATLRMRKYEINKAEDMTTAQSIHDEIIAKANAIVSA